MKRWDVRLACEIENPEIDAFLEEVESVCRKHGYSISHEDGQGAFEITAFSEEKAEWLKGAFDATEGYDKP